jgi:predicted ATPase
VPDPAAPTAGPTGGEPADRAPLVGRAEEVTAIVALLRDGSRRLVTLTGPGGVGKTRLARAVALRLSAELPLLVVELASVRDPALALPTVARAAGLPERPGVDALSTVCALVGNRRMLLLLDNLEQLVACAADLAQLVGRCPNLLVLATSRAPLRIRAEHEVVVAPLGVPDAWAAADLDGVRAAPAVALLLDRAEAMGASIALTPENAETIASIVWRLDGLPLAIELAAARCRVLDPQTLLARLDDTMTHPAIRDLPERQQTVAATVDWSVELLTDAERHLFAALATFTGGFHLEAAEAVGAGPRVLSELTALVDQSLVTRVPGAGPGAARFRLLEPVRQYASARWSGSSEWVEASDRHASFFADLAASARPRLHGPELAGTLDALDRDHANLRAAYTHLLERGQADRAAVLAWDVWLFLALRGHAGEWRERLAAVHRRLDGPAQARWHFAAGALAYVRRELPDARRNMAAALVVARRLGDDELLVEARAMAALMATFVGDVGAADSLAQEGGPPAHQPGDDFARVLMLASQGQRGILTGDLPAAEEHLTAAKTLAGRTGNGFVIALVLNMQATLAELRGDETATLDLLAESVQRSVEDGMGWTLGYALPALAAVAARAGEDSVAARLAGASATLTGSTTAVGHVPASRTRAHAAVEDLRARLGAHAYGTAFDEGRALDLLAVGRLAASLRRPGPG